VSRRRRGFVAAVKSLASAQVPSDLVLEPADENGKGKVLCFMRGAMAVLKERLLADREDLETRLANLSAEKLEVR
jgi:hypothetical protein